MKTWSVGDRVEVREQGGAWVPAEVTVLGKEGVIYWKTDRASGFVSPRLSWPKMRASKVPAPRGRHMPPPPAIAEPVSPTVLEDVASALGWPPDAAGVLGPPREPRPFTPDPKPQTPGRSQAYMAHVRTSACIHPACKEINGIHAHHEGPRGTKAMGAKVSDFWAVPLCNLCHDRFHRLGVLDGCTADESERIFARAHDALLKAWLLRLAPEARVALLVAAFDRM